MTDRLFVYGTLAPGRPNAHVLADVPGTWESATVRGTLVQDGWGAAAGYPGILFRLIQLLLLLSMEFFLKRV